MTVLHVPSFGGGVVRVGSPNVQRTDEVLEADAFDIGARGQLVAASDLTQYADLRDEAVPSTGRWVHLYALSSIMLGQIPYALAVGQGTDGSGDARYYTARVLRNVSPPPTPPINVVGGVTPSVSGVVATTVQLPGAFETSGGTINAVLLNLGAREGYAPNTAPGLLVATPTDGTALGGLPFGSIGQFDALGTGAQGEIATGTHGQALYFRGIIAYNNHVFGWGFDASATSGSGYAGPNRLMFSNLGNPLKWGNDNQGAAGTDRAFTDSDAIVLGDAGELIRGGIVWNGKLYVGTNQQLHYIAGYGRNSFLTDGANPVTKSYNILGPKAVIEGPDQLLYQVSEQGLVRFDGASFEPIFKQLVDFHGGSAGYWGLIWFDDTQSDGYPGKTNQDLVWTAVDWDREQVIVGIPYCDASSGVGPGSDTVLIKFHTRSGGFTRQVFSGVALTAAGYFRRAGATSAVRMVGASTPGAILPTLHYAYQATQDVPPIMPTVLPSVTFGPYLPFGPDGTGVLQRAYLTLAWESSAALPIIFTITVEGDDETVDSYTLTIGPSAPGSPADGDVWVDTSETDTNLGNADAGSVVPARHGYLVKTRRWSTWLLIPGGGDRGTRMTVPLPLTRTRASRTTIRAVCTSAAGRFEVEDLGINPGSGKEAV